MFTIKNLGQPWKAAVLHALDANTEITFSANTIREDLQDAANLLDVWETPFMSMIAKDGDASNTLHQWPKLSLQAASNANRQLEGNDNLPASASDYALKMANYTQISSKVSSVSDTAQWVDGAADINKKASQISYKLKELKTDMETMLLQNIAALPGSSSAARQASGLAAMWITNTDRGAGAGADPVLSGTTQGYIVTAAIPGTNRTITEAMFRSTMQSCWTAGGNPKYALVGPTIKTTISEDFTGTATRFKDADTKKLILAVDIYESDFGTLQIVPDRYVGAVDAHLIDPKYVGVHYGSKITQKPLARTGLSEKTLIETEYTLWLGNEASGGIVTDVTA
jgi:hypothetical protein